MSRKGIKCRLAMQEVSTTQENSRCSLKRLVVLLQVRAERMGMEGEGKEGGDERREGLVPAGPRR